MSNIIYQLEWDFINNKTIEMPYCGKCFTPLAMLGLLDKNTNKIQFICNKCHKIILK
jgi:hypothetical protein